VILPPAAQPPVSPDSPAGPDGDPAGLGPDLAGLVLQALADRDEPDGPDVAEFWPGDDEASEGWPADVPAGLAAGLAEGGPLDGMGPGGALAGISQHALDDGLAGLDDDALVGLIRGSLRVSAWQAGVELTAIAELDRRRLAQSGRPGWSRVSEHISAELAAALVLTGRSADSLLGFARDLGRLPAVLRALLAGTIDRARAMIFAAELSALSDRAANATAAALLPNAAGMTTGQLRNALRTLVHAIDPNAVRRRMAKARQDARVEAWQEGSGNLALAGRELDPADAVVADRRITAIAQALQDAGATGSLDQLRAAVFTALLAGRDPDTLAPAPTPGAQDPATAGGGEPVATDQPGQNAPADGPASPASGIPPGGLATLGGSVHLTLPASTWLGLTDLPGEAAGLGRLDAWTSRDLADRLAASRSLARWCITLIKPDGTAASHACIRAGPGPPADRAARRAWLARQQFTWLEPGTCNHGSQVKGYRPPNLVCDLIRARNRTCTFPGCRRPAVRCDLDHTVPYDKGGRTCPCNLAPLCRRHHRTKQARGWTLTQPEPGTLTWTAPHGRTYTVTPSRYLS
jgi:Domain of unknown function (DUF222)